LDTIIDDKTYAKLREIAGNNLEIIQDSFFTYLTVSSANILSLLRALKEQFGMNYLSNLTAVDFGEEFEIVYHLYAIPDNQQKIVVKTRLPRGQAELTSVFSVYPTADWQEREVFDLMGISFSQHPNLVRVLLPDDFEGHPLRKDFKKEA
jgi:NADH-quinone oxidoreductase subunit C